MRDLLSVPHSQYNLVLTLAGHTEPACEYDYSYLLMAKDLLHSLESLWYIQYLFL